MKKYMGALIGVTLLFGLYFCSGSTNVVDSGTYKGTIKEVEPEKSEIYVGTSDGKTLELYFTDKTKLTRNGAPVDFSALKEGQNVVVEIEKVGKRLDPLSVQITE